MLYLRANVWLISSWIYLLSAYASPGVEKDRKGNTDSATTIDVENASGTPEVNPWLIGVVVSLAAFMEVLDTSIANVALPHIWQESNNEAISVTKDLFPGRPENKEPPVVPLLTISPRD
jgi:hypothetical protein